MQSMMHSLSNSQGPPQLPPLAAPIGLFPAYFARGPECLVLQERVLSLSGDSFRVQTLAGGNIIGVQGNAISLSGRKNVTDAAGAPMFDLRKNHFSVPASFRAETGDGKTLFEVKGKFALGGSKQICSFTDCNTGKVVELMVKGNFFDTSANITNVATGQAVAQINRKLLNMREVFGNQQTYYVSVAQGMDLALVAAMCICLDEKRNEK